MHRILELGATFAVLGALAGCGGEASAGDGLTETLTCPVGWENATSAVVLWGDTASQRSDALVAERREVVESQLLSAAGCDIPVTVMWVPSQTAATTLFSGSVAKDGANEKIVARLSGKEIDEVAMPQIERLIEGLITEPPVETSSPTGLFDVIKDVRGHDGGDVVVTVLDNFVEQSERVNVNAPDFDADAAVRAVKTTVVPRLDGTRIMIMGAAVTVDTTPAPDDWVAAVRGYADGLCAKTQAECTPATTQYLR
jgi:hypothetical protein